MDHQLTPIEEGWFALVRVFRSQGLIPPPPPTARLWNAYLSVFGDERRERDGIVYDADACVLDALDVDGEQMAEWRDEELRRSRLAPGREF